MVKLFNMIPTKDVCIGYVTVINSMDSHSYIENTVIALRRVKYGKSYRYETILSEYPYYSVNKISLLNEMLNSKKMFVTIEELKVIVNNERTKYKIKEINNNELDILSRNKIQSINNELDINKKLEKVA